MRSSGELVARASEMLGVQPGKTENRTAFLQRLVYTITGLMGYASLWDMPEDGTDISITHFKQRIHRTLESYLAVYPELQSTFNVTDDTLYEEIYQVFRLTGCLYHTPYRIAPPAASAAAEGAIVFTRGMGLSDIGNVSGLGTYRKNSEEKTNYSVTEMFALNPPLREIWNQWIRSASWSADNLPEMREYLRTCPPFSYSYAAAIGAQIEAVLQKTQMQLQRCTCASACYNCLKHYRNQMVHGQLDRFAALELLHWGKNGVLAPPVSTEKQVEYVRPLEKVLLHAGIELLVDGGMLRIRKKNHEKQLVVYPAMWACSTAPDIVYLSDAQIRFAKPYAASVLMDSL